MQRWKVSSAFSYHHPPVLAASWVTGGKRALPVVAQLLAWDVTMLFRSGTLDVWSPILADHDRSQHAERQASAPCARDTRAMDLTLHPPDNPEKLCPIH